MTEKPKYDGRGRRLAAWCLALALVPGIAFAGNSAPHGRVRRYPLRHLPRLIASSVTASTGTMVEGLLCRYQGGDQQDDHRLRHRLP